MVWVRVTSASHCWPLNAVKSGGHLLNMGTQRLIDSKILIEADVLLWLHCLDHQGPSQPNRTFGSDSSRCSGLWFCLTTKRLAQLSTKPNWPCFWNDSCCKEKTLNAGSMAPSMEGAVKAAALCGVRGGVARSRLMARFFDSWYCHLWKPQSMAVCSHLPLHAYLYLLVYCNYVA